MDQYENDPKLKQYENMLVECKDPIKIPKGYMAPWPYNLLNDILDDEFKAPLDPDRREGLHRVLNSFPEKPRTVLIMRYQSYMTLDEIAKELKVTKEAIRQSIASSIKKMRYPANFVQIIYGIKGSEKRRTLDIRERNLDIREKAIVEREKKLAISQDGFGPFNEKIDIEGSKKEPWGKGVSDEWISTHVPSDKFRELGLSVYSGNQLLRAGINTVEKLVTTIQDGKLMNVRNIGKVSYNEIVSKVTAMTGIRFEETA